MKNTLKDISDSLKILIQQNKEKNSFVQTGKKSRQIQTQNNFGSYNMIKPLCLNDKNNKFRIYENTLNKTDAIYLLISFSSAYFIAAKIYFDSSFGINFYKGYFVAVFLCIILLLIKKFVGKKNYFTLEDDKVILKFKENIELNYFDIRSYLTVKALYGYSIYIYEIDKILPEIEFNIESIHEVNAIEEFLSYKLQLKN